MVDSVVVDCCFFGPEGDEYEILVLLDCSWGCLLADCSSVFLGVADDNLGVADCLDVSGSLDFLSSFHGVDDSLDSLIERRWLGYDRGIELSGVSSGMCSIESWSSTLLLGVLS